MKSIKKLFTHSITAALVTACVSLAGLTGCSPAGSSGGFQEALTHLITIFQSIVFGQVIAVDLKK